MDRKKAAYWRLFAFWGFVVRFALKGAGIYSEKNCNCLDESLFRGLLVPTPAVSLKLKKFRRHFGIAAPKVVVRRHLAWHWWALAVVFVVVFVMALVSIFSRGGLAGSELEALKEVVRVQGDELKLLRSMAGTGLNQLEMEQTTRQRLQGKIIVLEQENAALKEDLMLFERLVPSAGDVQEIRIENFNVVQEEPMHYRYRLFLAFQPGKQGGEFKGRLQLTAVFGSNGEERRLDLPVGKGAGDSVLSIRHFLRREGGFDIPLGAVLNSVEVCILQGEVVKARRMLKL